MKKIPSDLYGIPVELWFIIFLFGSALIVILYRHGRRNR